MPSPSSPKFRGGSPEPKVTVFRDRGYKEVIKFKHGQLVAYKTRTKEMVHCEHTVR